MGAYLLGRARKQLHLSLTPHETFVLFLVESLVVGVLMSKVVEYPALRLRDRLFPASVSAITRIATDTRAILPTKPETAVLQQVTQ